ncbi:MAG: YadA C-terminal domain-containing protein [Duodenibacillus sp.]|nr:YadA C-terminal domain-containing protein [Duodenibacillus sp.]
MGLIANAYNGIDANSQRISQNTQRINMLDRKINKVSDKVKRVGAGAAALASLRPQDLSDDNRYSAAVGIGHYDGKTAVAVGMFAQPLRNLVVGFGAASAGGKEVMANASVSYRFGGPGSHSVFTQSAINGKVIDLEAQNRALTAQLRSSDLRMTSMNNELAAMRAELAAIRKSLGARAVRTSKAARK